MKSLRRNPKVKTFHRKMEKFMGGYSKIRENPFIVGK